MKIAYPTIFTELETNILIEVPDLGILTEAYEEGKTFVSIVDADLDIFRERSERAL